MQLVTIMTTSHIIPAKENGVHLVIKKTANISQMLNVHWLWASSLHHFLFVVCCRKLFGEDCYTWYLHPHSKKIKST